MAHFSEEALFYNAIAVGVFGDQRMAARIRGTHATWREAYESLRELLRVHPRAWGEDVLLPSPDDAGRELESRGVSLRLIAELDFPPPLREIPHPPHAIYFKGDLSSLFSPAPAIAIVGTRRASPEGIAAARSFGRALAEAGAPIVSGLAFGIDAAAHEGTLDAAGRALAVLAGGLRSVYPRNHESLAERILAAGGGIVSEYPLTESPLPRRFIERNRIVSGLSRGVLIVEAPEDSGALSTARFALEQNRDVFVTPGGIAAGGYRGSNRLIQQGAALVVSPRDILESYGMVKERSQRVGRAENAEGHGSLSHEESLVTGAIAELFSKEGRAPDVDKISSIAKLEPRIVNRTLTFLILKDVVREEPGGYAINEHGY